MTTVVRTTNLSLASHWLASGLRLIEATAVEDARKVAFVFDDPEQRERRLTSEFFGDTRLLNLLRARSDLAHAIYRAKTSPSRRCAGEGLLSRDPRRGDPGQ